jgi:hypothetical protein
MTPPLSVKWSRILPVNAPLTGWLELQSPDRSIWALAVVPLPPQLVRRRKPRTRPALQERFIVALSAEGEANIANSW